MEYQRSDRVGDLILEVIAELLRKDIRDPRVQTVTLTGVKVSKDLRMPESISTFSADKILVLTRRRV